MTAATAPPAQEGARPARQLPQALVGYVLEAGLSGLADSVVPAVLSSPWDLWWASFRLAIPAAQLPVATLPARPGCSGCAGDAGRLAAADPPGHPGLAELRACGCLLDWAIQMRAPAPRMPWPALPLTLALIKPGAPARDLRARLLRTCEILDDGEEQLTVADVRRLYPEAYGAAFVAAVDDFLTAAPVRVLVLRWRDGGCGDPPVLKRQLRRELGAADAMRNHLHMADNPAEALADIRHLAGQDTLEWLYERHARDGAADRLAFYRAALGVRQPGSDGHA